MNALSTLEKVASLFISPILIPLLSFKNVTYFYFHLPLSNLLHIFLSSKKEGMWFGLEEFFTGDARSCFAKSLEFTSIVYIERKDFLEVLSSFPQDKEAFSMIKDKIKFSQQAIGLTCNICHSIFHKI